MSDSCYHCGEPVPADLSLSVIINGEERPMCCHGCQAVAETIINYGLENYYQFRDQPAIKPELLPANILRQLEIYDDENIQTEFLNTGAGDQQSVHLLLEGIVCPACTWLIESRLKRQPGIHAISVNYSNNRAHIQWDNAVIHLSDILKTIHALGYKAYPYDPKKGQYLMDQEGKAQLRRLGLAGLLGMQVMMLAIALYTGDWAGMEMKYREFFYWISLLLTTPVVFYSGRTFFIRAWRDIRSLHTGMDVPVSLGITFAFGGSVWTTITGNGHVYYDSVVMFIFFLLMARYVEFSARKRAMQHYDQMARVIPAMATRINNGVEEQIPVIKLTAGDEIQIRPGETIPADGHVMAGETTVNEAIISGESRPIHKVSGDKVIGGSTNIDSPLRIKVEKTGQDTVLAAILRLLESGQQQKPHITQLTNRVAAWFVSSVLILATGVALYWWQVDNAMWLPITIAVLVITCPCALSLATPAAVSAASAKLMHHGLAIVNNDIFETLARASCYIFDKTGTLSHGKFSIQHIDSRSGNTQDQCLALAAALERQSEHPIARAIMEKSTQVEPVHAEQISNHPGKGISGIIAGSKYYLGTAAFIRQGTGLDITAEGLADETDTTRILLADGQSILAVFSLIDAIRPGAEQLIRTLKQKSKKVILLSGDAAAPVQHIATELGITEYHSQKNPAEKLAIVEKLKQQGEIVAVTGDGINDAPVLAAAHASLAMGAGVDITRLNADAVLMNNDMDSLCKAIILSGKTVVIIRQNIIWAIAYNLLALPAAVTGMVAPWLAAIGMSLSSLIVVINTMRLNRS